MELKVIEKIVYDNGNESVSEKVFNLKERKFFDVASFKAEEKVSVKRFFRTVGYKLVMKNYPVLSITPQSISKDGVSFTISGVCQPQGNFVMVKNPKKGDVYVLGKGESITFKASTDVNYEFNISIKETK